ncbi:MAG: RNA polymerase subunit sigma, partial [Firmicutes bacterium]|nr:RNA polymerase subunit sigma [Bacillota bacterium]
DYREIAAQLERSPKSVDNAIQRIRRKLKDFFN